MAGIHAEDSVAAEVEGSPHLVADEVEMEVKGSPSWWLKRWIRHWVMLFVFDESCIGESEVVVLSADCT